eukprot:scaffold104291_cov25-Prasinocladus_malaysianus.AAC.1
MTGSRFGILQALAVRSALPVTTRLSSGDTETALMSCQPIQHSATDAADVQIRHIPPSPYMIFISLITAVKI